MTPDELTAAREALGLSQSELARALGLPRIMIWRYENGRYKVPQLMDMALVGVAASLKPRKRSGRRSSSATQPPAAPE